MKVVILAGGFGTRLSEYTDNVPKPMVKIGEKPILWHIMEKYATHGFTEFVIALGYKADYVKEFFLNFRNTSSDLTINLGSGEVRPFNPIESNWKITLVDTGLETLTGGRLKRLAPYLNDEPFMLTYGDGLADVDVNELVKCHEEHGKMVTVTAVRPPARFGELMLNNIQVTSFQEKPQMHEGWINGGYFVMEPQFLELIDGDSTVLESDPLENAAAAGELMAFKHEGFWQCMDTKRDRDMLQQLWISGQAPWI